MIEIKDGRLIHLKTNDTSYVMRALPSGQIEHIYYGKRLEDIEESEKAITEKNLAKNDIALSYDEKYPSLDLDSLSLEASSEGKGDFKSPLVKIKGKRVLDFKFAGTRIYPGIKRYRNMCLPVAVKDDRDAETLEILLEEEQENISIILCYTLFREENVISRKTIVRNGSDKDIEIIKCASMQLDLNDGDYDLITLRGAWLRENKKQIEKLTEGRRELTSNTMSTGYDCNNTFALLNERGECYISSLIYSSDFSTTIDKLSNGKVHIISGIKSDDFSWTLKKGEDFESPEALICYSEAGLEGASLRFKEAIKSVIMRSNLKERVRPVILSTKEIETFSINEKKVESLAKSAQELGFEALVLDDGWFSVRRDAESSLGDWYPNPLKFPEGIKLLSNRIHKAGLLFGLYFDIESVSLRSNLYDEHRNWVLREKGRKEYSTSADEFLLDFSRSDVQDWAIDTLSEIINTVRLDYLRYEKSRLPSEIPNKADSAFSLRYIMGVYNVLNTISRKFPHLILEVGMRGSARFDLGMLSYASLIRTSECTDPIERADTIEGLRTFYPEYASLATIASGVDKYTFRNMSLETKFNASAFTSLEYSADLTRLDDMTRAMIRNQIEFYKHYRTVLQFGDIRTYKSGNKTIWSASSKDKSTIIVLYLLKKAEINRAKERLYILDANEDYKYRIYSRNQIPTEDYLKYPPEIECYELWGDALKWAGIALSEKTGSATFVEDMRKMEDYSSRLYIIRKIEK